jgi:hypothetical protein
LKDKLWIFGDSYGAKDENWIKDLHLTLDCCPEITNQPGTSFNWAVRVFTRLASKIKRNDRVLFLIPDFNRFEVINSTYNKQSFHCTSTGFVYNENKADIPVEVDRAINKYIRFVHNEYSSHIDHLVMCKWLQDRLDYTTKYNCMIHTINNPNVRTEMDHIKYIDYTPHVEEAIYNMQSAWFKFYNDKGQFRKETNFRRQQVLHSPNHWVDKDGWKEFFYRKFGRALNRLSPEPVEFGNNFG